MGATAAHGNEELTCGSAGVQFTSSDASDALVKGISKGDRTVKVRDKNTPGYLSLSFSPKKTKESAF